MAIRGIRVMMAMGVSAPAVAIEEMIARAIVVQGCDYAEMCVQSTTETGSIQFTWVRIA